MKDQRFSFSCSAPARLCGLLAVCFVLGPAWGVARKTAAKPKLCFRSIHLGPSGCGVPADILSTSVQPWANASAFPQLKGTRWNQALQPNADAPELAVVTTGFGDRADAYIFRFLPETGAPFLVTHTPFRISILSGGARAWIPPTDGVASALRLNWPPPVPASDARHVRLRVMAWKTAAETGGLSSDLTLSNPGDAVSSAGARAGLAPLTAMVYAAASEVGLVPDPKAKTEITVEIRFKFKSASFRAVFSSPTGEKDTRVYENINQETYAENLTVLFRAFRYRRTILDVCRLSNSQANVLSVTNSRICFRSAGKLAIYDLSRRQVIWPKTEKSALSCAAISRMNEDSAKPRRVFLYHDQFFELNPNDGKQHLLAATGASDSTAFAPLPAAGVVLRQGKRLVLYHQQKKRWEYKADEALSAGPTLAGAQIVVAAAAGWLLGVDVDSGKLKWKKQVARGFRGRVIANPQGTRVLLFSRIDETLYCFSTRDGTFCWKQKIGDLLLTPPRFTAGGILVGAKNNRILLLSPQDGQVKAERKWKTWLVAMSYLETAKPLVVFSDIRGRTLLLDPVTLKIKTQLALKTSLAPGMVAVPRFQLQRTVSFASDNELDRESHKLPAVPIIAVTDTQGFCYLITPLAAQP